MIPGNLMGSGAYFDTNPLPKVPKSDGQIAQELIVLAYGALMTGPKATPPKWKTVKRILRQLKQQIPINGRKIRQFDEKTGLFIIRHPTKRRPVVVL